MKLIYTFLVILRFLYPLKGEVYCSSHGCDEDRCLPLLWVCDGFKDCKDGSDEAHCDHKCEYGNIQCLSGSCIPKAWRCDGSVDCEDGSDEENCSNVICEDNKFSCPDSNICIEQSLVCDGFVHCPNGSDESSKACEEKVCPKDSIKCDRGSLCVPQRWICNHVKDCVDGTDELNCSARPIATCQKSEFQCRNFDCISEDYVCDSFKDCLDGSDEENCKNYREDDACSKNNGGCSHLCNLTSGFGRCQCFPGYQLSSNDGHSCLDVDECKTPGMCSQLCENLPGTFKCSCLDGFVQDPSDNSICHEKPLINITVLLTVLLCICMTITVLLLTFALIKKWRSINSKKITFHGSTLSSFHESEFINKPLDSIIITSEDKSKHLLQVA